MTRGGAPRRSVAWLLLAAVLLPGAAARAQAQAAPEGFEQGLFEVRLARIPPATWVVLVSPGGAVLLPVREALEVTGTPFESDGRVLSVAGPAGEAGARLDLEGREIRRGDVTVALQPDELVLAEGQAFLAAPRLAELLDAIVDVDWGELAVTLSRDPPFPAQKRLVVDERRAALAAPAAGPVERVPFRARTGGAVLEWNLFSSGELARPGVQGGVGVAVLGGELNLTGTLREGGSSRGASPVLAHYRREFPAWPLLSRIQLGDVLSEGLLARPLRGVAFTNTRTERDPLFDYISIAPSLPQGWDYEVYQDGRMLGFSDATTRAPVAVPLRYGATPIQVRMHGPAGEEVVTEYLYQIPSTQLRPGRWEYAAGAGRCVGTGCDALAYLDVRHGVHRWITAGAGVEWTADSVRRTLRPQGSLALALDNGWTAELRAARASFARLQLQYTGHRRVAGSAVLGVHQPGTGELTFLPSRSTRWQAETGVTLQGEGGLPRTLSLRARAEGATEGALERWRLAAGTLAGRSYLEAAYEANRLASGDLLELRSTTALPSGWPAALRNQSLAVGVGLQGSSLQQADLGTSLRLGRDGFLSVGARWSAHSAAPSLALGYAARLGPARVQARGTVSGRGDVSLSSALGGILTLDRRAGLTLLPSGGVGAAGVRGQVFYDHDADGRLGAGDEPAAEVAVLVGGMRVTTDAHGFYRIWAVAPYEVVPVAVDTLGSLEPGWTPVRARQLIRPVPNMYTRVDFPLLATRDLAGRLEGGPGVPTVGGVTLELLEVATGRVERVTTFFDGEFYVSRLRPGEYELRVAESSLRALGARSVPEVVRFTISAAGEDPLMELEPILLERPT